MINRPHIFVFMAITAIFTLDSCSKYTRLITDEVVLKDGNSQTGTILNCDSLKLSLKKIDESIFIIPWEKIDSVKGKKLKTFWVGFNYGYYSTPYFSVFGNEAINAKDFGSQMKFGIAMRGNKLFYVNVFHLPAERERINKKGFGYQYYIKKTNYLSSKSLFVGSEINLMNVSLNNGSQLTIDPFIGLERKWKEQVRFQLKLGLQLNMFNRNNTTGFNFSIGTTLLKKNFQKQYALINKEHKLIK